MRLWHCSSSDRLRKYGPSLAPPPSSPTIESSALLLHSNHLPLRTQPRFILRPPPLQAPPRCLPSLKITVLPATARRPSSTLRSPTLSPAPPYRSPPLPSSELPLPSEHLPWGYHSRTAALMSSPYATKDHKEPRPTPAL